jgi:hypothetical protein
VFPLPVEGAETRVLTDDQEVLNYMIDLGESLELVRYRNQYECLLIVWAACRPGKSALWVGTIRTLLMSKSIHIAF